MTYVLTILTFIAAAFAGATVWWVLIDEVPYKYVERAYVLGVAFPIGAALLWYAAITAVVK